MKARTSLGLIARAVAREPLAFIEREPPPIDVSLLVRPGINPNKQRKGRSGEVARRRGRKG